MKIVNTTPTKAVYSLAVNPHNDCHLLSHVDNQITIWDTRYFEKPVLTLPQNRQVTKVLWCPTRNNLLGSLQKDSGSLYLHDIQQCGPGDDTEPGVLERTVVPPWTNPTSFSWHPKHTNRLLGISQQGKSVSSIMYFRFKYSRTKILILKTGGKKSDFVKYFSLRKKRIFWVGIF